MRSPISPRSQRLPSTLGVLLLALPLSSLGCSSDTVPPPITTGAVGPSPSIPVGSGTAAVPMPTGGTPSTGGGTIVDCPNGVCEPGAPLGPDGPAPPGCGDGALTPDEACDDANVVGGDGCTANCLGVEPGFSCAVAGMLCLAIARCGDGVVALSEQCDDGARVDGDGCSATCKYEPGMKCTGSPSMCTAALCGDMIPEGAESCDDGNTRPFDGCSDKCEKEPTCMAGGAGCTSECGDGLVLGEECDDGNRIKGDGCSDTCVIEPGFTCTEVAPPCEQIGGVCVFRAPAVYRDFGDDHPDFGEQPDECKTMTEDGQSIPAMVLTEGLVQAQVDAEGRPQLMGASGQQECADLDGVALAGFTGIDSAASFSEWFRDVAPVAISVKDLVLFDNGDGGFVNRYGEMGEQFLSYDAATEMWAADAGQDCPAGVDCHPCSWDLDKAAGAQQMCTADELSYDGNPLFFPVDDLRMSGTDIGPAKVPAEYGYDAWPWEEDVFPGATDHNFYFTTEVQTWFEFTATTNATLEFTGDDDVWVFVNGTLALDLGGIHVPEDGSVIINAQTATRYGLTAGNVYNITVFQAERRMEGSSFRLTLSGFEPTPSDCAAFCGDGIVSFGEECDDIVNDGGYGECGPGCVLSEFCGDGVINGPEQCDNGATAGTAMCSGCRRLTVR